MSSENEQNNNSGNMSLLPLNKNTDYLRIANPDLFMDNLAECERCHGSYIADRQCESCRFDIDSIGSLKILNQFKKTMSWLKKLSHNGGSAGAVVCEQKSSHNGKSSGDERESAGAVVIDGQQPSDNRESAGAGAEVCEQRFIPMGGKLLTIKYGDVGNPYEGGMAECLHCGNQFAADSYCRGCNK